jgi:hypothetical protein
MSQKNELSRRDLFRIAGAAAGFGMAAAVVYNLGGKAPKDVELKVYGNVQPDDEFVLAELRLNGGRAADIENITVSPFDIRVDYRDGTHATQRVEYEKIFRNAEGLDLRVVVDDANPRRDYHFTLANPLRSDRKVVLSLEDSRHGRDAFIDAELDIRQVEAPSYVYVHNPKSRLTISGLSHEQIRAAQTPINTFLSREGFEANSQLGTFTCTRDLRFPQERIQLRDRNGEEVKDEKGAPLVLPEPMPFEKRRRLMMGAFGPLADKGHDEAGVRRG